MIIDLRLIGKRVVDFLLVLIELFSLGVTARIDHRGVEGAENRDAEGVEGGREWEGDTFPQPTSGLEERRHELPPAGSELRSRAPAENDF